MKNLLVMLLVGLLLLPSAVTAKEKILQPGVPQTGAKTAPTPPGETCPMITPGKPGMMGMMGPEKWWRVGAMSQVLMEMLKKAGAVLAEGNLKPEGQKQLAATLQQIRELIPTMFGPGEAGKMEDTEKKLQEAQGVLEKLEAQSRAK